MIKQILACCLAATLAGPVAALSAPPLARHLLAKVPEAHGKVQLAYTFPSLSHPDQIVAGEDVAVLLSVRNGHDSPVNLTFVTGMLASSQNFAVNIANFSVGIYAAPVQPGTDRSFEYHFATPERMPNRPFRVALTAFYDVDDGGASKHATTFFNQTVELMEPEKAIDTEALGLLFTFVCFIGAALWFAWPYIRDLDAFKDFQKQRKRKAAAAAPVEQRTVAPADRSDYLTGTNLMSMEKKRGKKRT